MNSTSTLVILLIVWTLFLCASCRTLPPCNQLHYPNVNCIYNCTCRYGMPTETPCSASTSCAGDPNFTVIHTCKYCYQLDDVYHICSTNTSCNSYSTDEYISSCSVPDDVFCIGSRNFQKVIKCNFTTGYQWSVAFLLSLFLGGFGVDRFYLHHIGWGIFKLLSFGGLGIWAFIDIILVGIGYITPGDGSVYSDL